MRDAAAVPRWCAVVCVARVPLLGQSALREARTSRDRTDPESGVAPVRERARADAPGAGGPRCNGAALCAVRGGAVLIGTGACGGRAWLAPVTKEQGGELFSGVRAGPGSLPCVSAAALMRRAQAAHGGVQRGRPVCRAWCVVVRSELGRGHAGGVPGWLPAPRSRRRVVRGREGGRAGNCQPAGAGEPGRPVACPRREVPVWREEGPTPEEPPFSHVRSLSCQWARTEEKEGRFVSKDARFGCGRIVLKWRVGRAGRCVEERGTEAGKHHPQVRPLMRALRALRACAMRRAQRRGAPPPRAARVRAAVGPRALTARGESEEGAGTTSTPPPPPRGRVRACGLACASSDRKERPASCDVAQLARAASPRDRTRLGRTCGGRAERRVTAMKIHCGCIEQFEQFDFRN